jgi:DNA-binding NtrC family response regulator
MKARRFIQTGAYPNMGAQAWILIVDDDPSIRRSISKILEHEGYLVDTAENGKEAIAKSEKNFYNLALIDIRLPDMEGTELLTSLKETYPRMGKIMVTGYPLLQNAIEAVNKGADFYLTKPVNIDELVKVVKEQLRKQEEEKKYSEEKMVAYVETKAKELDREKPP